jgi:hypothetical protein
MKLMTSMTAAMTMKNRSLIWFEPASLDLTGETLAVLVTMFPLHFADTSPPHSPEAHAS